MSIFSTILDKIFHRTPKAPTATQAQAPAAASPVPKPAPASAAVAAPQPVDAMAVLKEMAAAKGGGGNWQTSIVDLLKLLDMDSGLDARRQLAEELKVHAGEAGSAEQNIALSKAVMQKLSENGGKIPESLRD